MRRIKFKKSRINFLSKLLSLVLVLGLFFDSFVILGDAVSYYSVRINYCFIDGTPAHDPYIATFSLDSEVDLEVTNPVIDGFVPMALKEGEDDPLGLPDNGNEEKVGYTVKGGEIYFELKNISAPDIDTPYTLHIGDNDYHYAVTDYIKSYLTNGKNNETKALAAAMYYYNQAANNYFG